MNDAIDPALVAVLTQLWKARKETPERAWSLAKISKQSDLPMSVLKRQLTGLEDGGLVVVAMNEDGTGSAALTPQGETLCGALFGEA